MQKPTSIKTVTILSSSHLSCFADLKVVLANPEKYHLGFQEFNDALEYFSETAGAWDSYYTNVNFCALAILFDLHPLIIRSSDFNMSLLFKYFYQLDVWALLIEYSHFSHISKLERFFETPHPLHFLNQEFHTASFLTRTNQLLQIKNYSQFFDFASKFLNHFSHRIQTNPPSGYSYTDKESVEKNNYFKTAILIFNTSANHPSKQLDNLIASFLLIAYSDMSSLFTIISHLHKIDFHNRSFFCTLFLNPEVAGFVLRENLTNFFPFCDFPARISEHPECFS